MFCFIEFDDYFKNLIPSKNTRNPWFKEYWEETYKCKFQDTPTTIFNQNYTRLCSGLIRSFFFFYNKSNFLGFYLDSDSTDTNFFVPYFQEGYVHYVVDAVFTLVISIQNLIDEKCPNSSKNKPLCKEFYPFNGTRLLTILRNITFHNGKIKINFKILIIFLFLELSKRLIRFTSNGDGIAPYDIFQYQIINTPDTLDYLTIGEFSDSDRAHER